MILKCILATLLLPLLTAYAAASALRIPTARIYLGTRFSMSTFAAPTRSLSEMSLSVLPAAIFLPRTDAPRALSAHAAQANHLGDIPSFAASAVPLGDALAAALDREGEVYHSANGKKFRLILRRGENQFGREVLVVDILDPAAPELGAIAHIDLSISGDYGQASLDGPLDSYVGAGPQDVDPNGLAHWREHMWFGLSVLPQYRGARLGKTLLETADGLMRARGARDLFINATEDSAEFYRKHYAGQIRNDEEYTGGDEARYFRIVVRLAD